MKPSRFLFQIALLIPLLAGIENPRAQSRDADSVPASSQCSLTLAEAPALLGMRLGMTYEETRVAAPSLELSRRKRKENGISTSLSSKSYEEAEGVVNSYLDDKLFEISVLFGSTSQPKNTAEFVREFSKKFNLPLQAWSKKSNENRYSMTCNGFTVEASEQNQIAKQNQIVITNTDSKKEIKRRADEVAAIKGNN